MEIQVGAATGKQYGSFSISKIPYDPSVPLVGIYQKRNPLIQKELTNVHCCRSAAQLCPTLCDPVDCSIVSFTISQSLLRLMSIELVIHPTISSSLVPFSCLQSFPESGSFPMSQCFASGGQKIGVSASPSSFQQIFRTDFL